MVDTLPKRPSELGRGADEGDQRTVSASSCCLVADIVPSPFASLYIPKFCA